MAKGPNERARPTKPPAKAIPEDPVKRAVDALNEAADELRKATARLGRATTPVRTASRSAPDPGAELPNGLNVSGIATTLNVAGTAVSLQELIDEDGNRTLGLTLSLRKLKVQPGELAAQTAEREAARAALEDFIRKNALHIHWIASGASGDDDDN